MVRLDDVNLRILELLQKDGRTGVADLARAVGRSESTVRERLFAMERDGVIKGYRAEVDWSRLGFPTHAILRADCPPEQVQEVAKRLASIPQVTSALFTTGPKPLRVEFRVKDLESLSKVMENHISQLPLKQIETSVVLQGLVEPRPVSIATIPGHRDALRAALPPLSPGRMRTGAAPSPGARIIPPSSP